MRQAEATDVNVYGEMNSPGQRWLVYSMTQDRITDRDSCANSLLMQNTEGLGKSVTVVDRKYVQHEKCSLEKKCWEDKEQNI